MTLALHVLFGFLCGGLVSALTCLLVRSMEGK